MVRYSTRGVLVLLFVASICVGATPERSLPKEISIEPFGRRNYFEMYAAGQDAIVVASGRGYGYVGLYVYDMNGNCVATDDFGSFVVRDDVAVTWHVPETGQYQIEIRSLSRSANELTCAFK